MSWPQHPGPQQVGPQQFGPQQPEPQPFGPQQPGPRQPAPPQSGWGNQARHTSAVQQPPYQPPSQRLPTPPRRPPRRRRRELLIVLVIVAVLAVAGVISGIVATGGKKHQSKSSHAATTPASSPSATPQAGGTQTRAAIAHNAETVVHGLGDGKPNEFCPLVDRVDLQRLLREKHLAKCADIKLTARINRGQYLSFRVTNPSAILMNGDTADIPATAIVPASFGTVEMREDSDGTWKFRFYTD